MNTYPDIGIMIEIVKAERAGAVRRRNARHRVAPVERVWRAFVGAFAKLRLFS